MKTDEHFVKEQDKTPIMGELDQSGEVETSSSDEPNVEHADEQSNVDSESEKEKEIQEKGDSKGSKFLTNLLYFVYFIISIAIVSMVRACLRG